MVLVVKRAKNKKKKTAPRVRSAAAAAPVSKSEVTALGKAIRSLGGALGASAGGVLGQPMAGGMLGHSLAGALSRWMGTGDYSVGTNTVVNRSLKAAASIPSMHNDQQSIVVRHKEYLGEIRSATAFTVQQSYPLNPGLNRTFPWLSGIASKFQEYKIRGMVFHYIPTSGSAVSSTNAALGSVMLQTSYRSTDSLPASKVEMLNEYCSNEVVPSETMAHPVECDPKENPFNVQYVRSGAVPGSDTQLMYDLGVTHVAVSGCQATGNILGDLWVTYDIELKKPVVSSDAVSSVMSASTFIAGGTIAVNSVFGSSTIAFTGSLAAFGVGNTITFPKGAVGKYIITWILGGSALGVTGNTVSVVNCSLSTIWAGSPATSFFDISGSTINTVTAGITISDPAVTPTVTVNFGGSGTLVTTRLTIAEVE